ncbi:MAG TPA: hypothetical protein VJR89_12925 [Polyangiales bacterium]|nr:hypothetical protein [Polyangiales bacterium]
MALSLLAASVLAPAHSRADMPDADNLLDYGFKGLTLGAEIGLAVGYLSTGSEFEDEEWRKLVMGAGVGALSGIGAGILLAVIDKTSGGVPGGYYLLRDAGYGALLGGATGALVGMLVWIDDGSEKNILVGAAWGALFGAGAGLLYGFIEANNAKPRDDDDDAALHLGGHVRLRIAPAPPSHGPGAAAVLYGPLDF